MATKRIPRRERRTMVESKNHNLQFHQPIDQTETRKIRKQRLEDRLNFDEPVRKPKNKPFKLTKGIDPKPKIPNKQTKQIPQNKEIENLKSEIRKLNRRVDEHDEILDELKTGKEYSDDDDFDPF